MARGQRGNNNRQGRNRSGRGGSGRRVQRPPTNRQYPRTARLNTLVQEIAAGFVDRIDDDRLPMITVTGVKVDSDLNRAQVFVSAFDDTLSGPEPTGEEALQADEELLAVLGEYAKGLRSTIGSETRLRKTPAVLFQIDPAVRTGARIEEILADIGPAEGVLDEEE